MLIWFLDRRDNNDQNLVPGTHSFYSRGNGEVSNPISGGHKRTKKYILLSKLISLSLFGKLIIVRTVKYTAYS